MSRWKELRVWNETGLTYRRIPEDEVSYLFQDRDKQRDLLYNFYDIYFEGKSINVYSFDKASVDKLCDLINNALVQPHTLKEIELNNLLKIVDKYDKIDSSIIEEAIKYTYKDIY